jgi:hypothetical protein
MPPNLHEGCGRCGSTELAPDIPRLERPDVDKLVHDMVKQEGCARSLEDKEACLWCGRDALSEPQPVYMTCLWKDKSIASDLLFCNWLCMKQHMDHVSKQANHVFEHYLNATKPRLEENDAEQEEKMQESETAHPASVGAEVAASASQY